MSSGPALQHRARRHAWWLGSLVVVPLLCALSGRWLIFHLFGNGSYIATGTAGWTIIDWWDRGGGRFLFAGMLGAVVAFVARRQPLLALAAGALAAGMTLVVEIAALLIYLSLNPGALD